jgi:hypothetical protein
MRLGINGTHWRTTCESRCLHSSTGNIDPVTRVLARIFVNFPSGAAGARYREPRFCGSGIEVTDGTFTDMFLVSLNKAVNVPYVTVAHRHRR